MGIGRPLEFDPDRALDAAVEVFWRKGFEAASMTDLLAAMDLSKSSLYQAFGGKRDLFERALARYRDRLGADLATRLDRAPSGRRFIEDVFTEVARTACHPSGARGCLIGNSATELGHREPELAGLVAKALKRFREVFGKAVRRAQAEGAIAPTANAEALAAYLVTAMTGLRAMIKAGMDGPSAKRMVPLILKALDP
jgi:TetR/AcrR family transcriptional repressor of nem operon